MVDGMGLTRWEFPGKGVSVLGLSQGSTFSSVCVRDRSTLISACVFFSSANSADAEDEESEYVMTDRFLRLLFPLGNAEVDQCLPKRW